MRRYRSIKQYASEGRDRSCALCIGNFDGVHLGHRHVIRTCIERSTKRDIASVVLTFEPHPLEILSPRRAPQRLTTPDSRASLLETTGLDHLVEHPFDRKLASVEAEDFISSFIVDGLGADFVVIGSRFRFGRRRRGNVDLLISMGRELGFEVIIARGFRLEGEVVSSRHIRRLIGEDGEVARAARLLGQPHALRGTIVRGQGRGRGLGFPTANLEQIPEIVPAPGVYACRAHIKGRSLPSAVHVGPRLTFDSVSTVEAHIIGHDHDVDLYGARLTIDFVHRIRDPKKFDDQDALVARIEEDVRLTIEKVGTAGGGDTSK